MTDAFEEVEEGLRRDKAAELWNKIFPWLLIVLALLVAAVGAWEFVKWQRGQAIEKDAAAFAVASTHLEKQDLAAARAALAPVAQGKGGYAVIANNIIAGIEAESTKDPKVINEHLTKASQDKGLLGDMSLLKLAYAQADALDLAALTTLVDPLVKKGGPMSALARELLAAKSLALGDVEKARREYQALQLDLDSPAQMKERVQQALYAMPAAPAGAAPAAPAPAAATTAPTGQPAQ